MKKLTELSTWLTVLPSAILAVMLVLSNNGVDLTAFQGFTEGLIAFCGALVVGGVAMPSKAVETVEAEKNETENQDE